MSGALSSRRRLKGEGLDCVPCQQACAPCILGFQKPGQWLVSELAVLRLVSVCSGRPYSGAMLSVDQQLDWADSTVNHPWNWAGGDGLYSQAPTRNSEQAVTCHFNETAHFLVTQRLTGMAINTLLVSRPHQECVRRQRDLGSN